MARLAALLLPHRAIQGIRRRSRSRHGFFGRTSRAIGQLLRVGGIPRGVETFEVGGVLLCRSDSQIASRLFWLGPTGWEPEVLPWWRQACARATRITELGANIGYWTVVGGSATDGTYVAVEPHPSSASVLRRNVELNGLSDRVTVVEAAAVADGQQKSVTLVIPTRDRYANPAGAFIPAVADAARAGRSLEVDAVPVGDVLPRSDLVKMDVEGAEAALLEASLDSLVVDSPTLFVEVLDEDTRLHELLVALGTRVGYSALVPSPERLVQVPLDDLATLQLQRRFNVRDLILTVDEHLLATVAP